MHQHKFPIVRYKTHRELLLWPWSNHVTLIFSTELGTAFYDRQLTHCHSSVQPQQDNYYLFLGLINLHMYALNRREDLSTLQRTEPTSTCDEHST